MNDLWNDYKERQKGHMTISRALVNARNHLKRDLVHKDFKADASLLEDRLADLKEALEALEILENLTEAE
jgi:hypothetical protein